MPGLNNRWITSIQVYAESVSALAGDRIFYAARIQKATECKFFRYEIAPVWVS